MASWNRSSGASTRSPWLQQATPSDTFDGEKFEEFVRSLEDMRDNRMQEARMLELMVSSMRSRVEKMKQADELRSQLENTLKQREVELRESLERKQNEVDKLRNRCDQDQQVIDELKDQNMLLHEEVKSQANKLNEKENEMEKLKTAIVHLQDHVKRLEGDLQSMDNETQLQLNQLPELRARITELEVEKENALTASKESQDLLSAVQADLTAANDTIDEMKEELTKAKSKISVLSEVSNKQDHLVTEKEGKLQQLQSDLKLCLARIQKKELEQQEQLKELERLKSKYKESQEKIATSDQLISFLKKQLQQLDNHKPQAQQQQQHHHHHHQQQQQQLQTQVQKGPCTSPSTSGNHAPCNNRMRSSSANAVLTGTANQGLQGHHQQHQQQQQLQQQHPNSSSGTSNHVHFHALPQVNVVDKQSNFALRDMNDNIGFGGGGGGGGFGGACRSATQSHLPVMSQSKYQRNRLFAVSGKSIAASSSTTTTTVGGRGSSNCGLEGFKCSKEVK